MSYVFAVPEFVTAAASDLANVASTIALANAAAAAATSALPAAAADEVSVVVATMFSAHGQAYQVLSNQASAFHQHFVQLLNAGALSYTTAEADAASPLQELLDAINAPFQTLLGRPLIGDGFDGTDGTGASGQNGGLLWGNGGAGVVGGGATVVGGGDAVVGGTVV
ncbi:PE family protein, partial [Mycobacterium asiaticum]|uniref:PE family protein n=1 Tax=Mycobacterium asiaticum TaxID=1790 RepID=UPI000AF96D1B